jgi:hypothetical protein
MAKWTVDDIPDQTGRTIFVTGASSGLGLRSAEALASRGARVLMGCRNQEKAAVALETIKNAAAGPAPKVVPLDLADLDGVRVSAERLIREIDRLDVLMNNAGTMVIPHQHTAFTHDALDLPCRCSSDIPRSSVPSSTRPHDCQQPVIRRFALAGVTVRARARLCPTHG